ncbi:hypothetical protein GS429_18640 [Natronorubrum sp. JWXQ-INN-674]|uniref:DUF7344 domain-containing protein n=1 Tax=Natronorubrum halalkaliphilum TaxID=2691917 RepID=A0A6B0VRH9_9EURY|nr:hypothetical protein [Natronorubrum halalkaliphilum]MXV64044.1 hypothetical protein [Natronorubrum halalkaliphilum]
MDPERQSSNGPNASPSTIDAAFLALRDRTRRFVVYFLLEHETASLSEVADVVTGWLHTPDCGVIEPRCRNTQYLNLLHTQIPNLVEAGVVRHDEDDGTLSLAPCPAPVREFATRACAAETGT